MSDVDATLYALLAQSSSAGLPLLWLSSETAKWGLAALLRKMLRDESRASLSASADSHEQGV